MNPNSACGVYTITNTRDGKVYVGSTALTFGSRWRNHLSQLRKGTHNNTHLQRAFIRDGESSFAFSIHVVCRPDESLSEEQKLIDALMTYDRKCGYNLCRLAGSVLGNKLNEASRQRISIAQRKRFEKPEARQERSRLATEAARNPETRMKMSESARRRGITPETRAKMTLARIGKPFTEERKRKLSDAAKRRYTRASHGGDVPVVKLSPVKG